MLQPPLPRVVCRAVAASYGSLSPVQREAIYELKKQKKSGNEIKRIVARGYKELHPFSVSAQHANAIARKLMIEREELFEASVTKMADGEAVETLARRLIVLADRESLRLQRLQANGKLDIARLTKLAGAVTKLQGMLERMGESGSNGNGEGKKDDAPTRASFAERLLQKGQEPHGGDEAPALPIPAEVADVIVRGAVGASDRAPALDPKAPPGA